MAVEQIAKVNLNELLSEAYRLDQTQRSRQEAIDFIRKAINDEPVIEPFLRDLHMHHKRIHGARAFPHQTGDHVSKVITELLDRIFP